MSLIQRFFSKLLDYLWFWSILMILIDFFSLSLYLIVGVTLLLPLLFAPIEALAISYVGTTLGKAIFGIRYEERLPLAQSIKVSFRKAFWTLPLFVPIVNLFFAYFFILDPKKNPSMEEANLGKLKLIFKYPKRGWHLFLIVVAFILSIFCFVPDTIIDPIEKVARVEKPGFFKGRSFDSISAGDWIKVERKDDLFTIFFPKEPKYQEETHDVPSSDYKLTYKEYSLSDSIDYNLGYTELPSAWTRWGSSLVLKGAIKVLAEQKGRLVYKKITTHESFPAIEYQMNVNNSIVFGKLILVGKTLFRVEITQKKLISEEDRMQAQKFFYSFHPEKKS